MKIYIFGSNGFLGKNLVKKLNYEHVLCDNGFLVSPISPGTKDIDITKDSSLIEKMFKNENGDFVVINLAAIHSIPYCNNNQKMLILPMCMAIKYFMNYLQDIIAKIIFLHLRSSL